VMGLCENCTTTMVAETYGPSPLLVDAENLDLTLDKEHVLHVYVWNPQGQLANGNVYATTEQAFAVRGTATLLAKP
jgi:hypothetical protein